MRLDNNQRVFFNLLRAGLWGDQGAVQEFKSSRIQDSVDWEKVYQLAQEQSVQGLVLQGIEELRAKGVELSVPKVLLLQWIGEVQVIEQRNKDMNAFIADLIEKLRRNDVYAILVKGQGIAQCYEKPLWRSSGDVDLFINIDNYFRAKNLIINLSDHVDEDSIRKHLTLSINSWPVELHGTLRSGLWGKIDVVIDEVQQDTFLFRKYREWKNGKTDISLPNPDNDVIFVFTHILQHFYKGGIGLRQICDWCRLLWTYRESLNRNLLETRIRKAGIMSEWRVFASFAVDYLGISKSVMPFCQDTLINKMRAEIILSFVLKDGNFGHKRDMSYRHESSSIKRKLLTFYHLTIDGLRNFNVFPVNSVRVWWSMMKLGLRWT